MDRNALLSQIQKGAKLKKVETNDRSTPQIGKSSKTNGTASSFNAVPPSINNGSAKNAPAAAPVGIGNIFANGIPSLKHRQGGFNVGKGASNDTIRDTPQGTPSWIKANHSKNSSTASDSDGQALKSKYNSSSTFSLPPTKPSGINNSSFKNEEAPGSNLPQSNSFKKPAEVLVTAFKKKPPPPPPTKSKPSFLSASASTNPMYGASRFSTTPRSSLGNISPKPPIDRVFNSDDSAAEAIRRGSAPNIFSRQEPQRTPLNSLPKIPPPMPQNATFLTEMKWSFHSPNDFPKILSNQLPKNEVFIYPSGRKIGSSKPLKI